MIINADFFNVSSRFGLKSFRLNDCRKHALYQVRPKSSKKVIFAVAYLSSQIRSLLTRLISRSSMYPIVGVLGSELGFILCNQNRSCDPWPLQDSRAHVVEVQVDIVRCEFAKFSGEIVGGLVIDHCVDVGFLYEPLNIVDLSIATNDLAIGMTT